MHSNASRKTSRGISVVEFVGCLAALGGGIVIGSIYLGVDVKAMAVGILEKADIDVPAALAEDATQTAPAQEAEASDGATQQLVDGGVALAEEEEELSEAVPGNSESVGDQPEPRQLSEEEQIAATKNCWTALSAAMKEEANNRSKSIRDPGSWQLFDYLLHRKDGHQKVVDAIESLDLNGVDQRLRAHVQQVLAWHRSGAELFERAAQLLTDAPAGKLSGPFAQSWQSASTQHRMEEQLILNKHKAVAGYLEHTQKSSHAGANGN